MSESVTDTAQYLLVLRRGEEELFMALRDRLEAAPVQVIWDRRLAERRRNRAGAAPERRRGERRSIQHALRSLLGVVLAAGERPASAESRSG